MNPPMDCPRCGQPAVTDPTCPRCGVVVAKARARAAATPAGPDRPAPSPAWEEESPAEGSPGRLKLIVAAALLVVAGAIGSRQWDRLHRSPGAERRVVAGDAGARPAGHAPALDAPPTFSAPIEVPLQNLSTSAIQVPDADRGRAEDLVRRLASPASMTALDVQAAEQLLASHDGERGLRDLLEAVLLNAAARHRRQHEYPQAIAYLERGRQVAPSSMRPPLARADLALEMEDWPGAESAARAALAVDPRSFEAWRALGFALMREDRNREAMDALRSALDIRQDSQVRGLLERIEQTVADEHGMAERHLAHFNVRYDGEAHEAVGRDVLRALERDYATLASVLDFEPANTIPVILFTRDEYDHVGGGPQYLGDYDGLDGRIRMPVAGVNGLSPAMEKTLLHELSHAFVADRTRGTAQRFPLQEGLAQYLEGKRTETLLDPRWVTALADGRIGGEMGAYLASLSFVEYLMAQRGQGGMNELLKSAGESGNMDEAFRQVYGVPVEGAIKAWSDRMRLQHGTR